MKWLVIFACCIAAIGCLSGSLPVLEVLDVGDGAEQDAYLSEVRIEVRDPSEEEPSTPIDVLNDTNEQDVAPLPDVAPPDEAAKDPGGPAPDVSEKDCEPKCEWTGCFKECSGNCGYCPAGFYCSGGKCFEGTPSDFGQPCTNGEECKSLFCLDTPKGSVCTASCTLDECPQGWECQEVPGMPLKVCVPAVSCKPDCQSKECGPDGCGGFCGSCPTGLVCGVDDKCHVPSDGCSVNEKAPGCGGCPCEEWVCNVDSFCCKEFWDVMCVKKCDGHGLDCQDCIPNCAAKECGDDGCGGSCGQCDIGSYCWYGSCVKGLPPDVGRACSADSQCISGVCLENGGQMFCSATCSIASDCPEGWQCKNLPEYQATVCVPQENCVPDCGDKTCGPDGCGGTCGECGQGQACSKDGQCLQASDGCTTNFDVPGCGGCACEDAVCAAYPHCCTEAWDQICTSACYNSQPGYCSSQCVPQCEDRECGFDGCFGYCGWCLPWEKCVDGKCVCIPQCEGRECGPDGCGGSCGTCPVGEEVYFCNSDGQCVNTLLACTPSDAPGCNGCPCEDCVCAAMPYCCTAVWDMACVEKCKECGVDCPQ